jgi:hypothetical protein
VIATFSAVEAAANVALGIRSEQGTVNYEIESALISYSSEDTSGYGDIDSVTVALMMTGYEAGYALVAWDAITDAGELFQ